MSNNEFYKSNEYNKTSEYQHFPAEMYLSNNDINFTGIENPNTGQEITTNNTNTKHNKKTNSSSKSLLNKIFDGIKSIATTAVVAVASIVATASISVAKPDIDLLYFSHGSNYVEYSISAKDINENSDYMLVISTTNEKDIEFEITSDGIYENRVDGLKPEWEYKISVIGKDDFLGTITYFEKKFQTTEINNNTELEQTPTLDIKDVTISGANTLEITYDFDAKTYNSENINNLLFNISYGDNNNQIVEISYDELVLGKKTLNISENISSITINSSFIFTNNQISKEIVSEEKVFELNNNFER